MDPKDWIGRTETVSDIVTATPYAALSATLDRPAERPPVGTPLPALWHWLYFLPLHRQSEIGPDGHAKRGGFLPPVPLPRRMWAGSQFEFHRPLRVGDTLTRVSTIQDVTEKSGRTGPLVFVKVRHEISRASEAGVALTEFHDIVYREAPKPGDPVPPAQPAPASAKWQKQWAPDDVLLFRYSALTFNGHRIHYDRRYATDPTKIESELGWRPQETFESGIEKTVRWYQANSEWVARTRSGEYLDYYERTYRGR